jgi:hypothetical protein
VRHGRAAGLELGPQIIVDVSTQATCRSLADEPMTVGSPAAVANAVSNALSVEVDEIRCEPERVREAIA